MKYALITILALTVAFLTFIFFGGHQAQSEAKTRLEPLVLTNKGHSEQSGTGERLQHVMGVNKFQPTVRYDQTDLRGLIQ